MMSVTFFRIGENLALGTGIMDWSWEELALQLGNVLATTRAGSDGGLGAHGQTWQSTPRKAKISHKHGNTLDIWHDAQIWHLGSDRAYIRVVCAKPWASFGRYVTSKRQFLCVPKIKCMHACMHEFVHAWHACMHMSMRVSSCMRTFSVAKWAICINAYRAL